MAGATKTITINAPLATVFQVVTDVERYPDFLPEVKSIKVTNKRGAECDVHYVAEVVKTIKYTVHLKEEPPDRVSWTFVDGEFMKDNKGNWLLEPQGENATKVTYNVEVGLGALVPKTIVNALIDTSLPKLLENFKKRAEGMAAKK
ncbi:MAG: SRPBCC family protein [Archangiaceae bacterium]|nr:SRPBCC family protein [Archangiaceae bacterium]